MKAKEKNKKALVIIPVYNEEKRLGSVLEQIPKKVLDIKVDILVVNDGSTDKSEKIARENATRVVSHKERLGYGRSVRDGFSYAFENGYNYVVKLDGDGQHDPRRIKTVIKILDRGDTDYVLSSRYLRIIDRKSKPPLERRLVNIMATGAINKITGLNLSEVFCGFFGLKTDIIPSLKLKTDHYGLELEMILKAHFGGYRLLEIPHSLIYFQKEGSKFTVSFGKEHNLGMRLELYAAIILKTLEELNIKYIRGSYEEN